MGYDIEGRLLEVCTCNVLCPCWVGENPDYETCDTTIAWGIEKGTIEGVDVEWVDDRRLGPHPREHPDPEVLEGRGLHRRSVDGRAARRAASGSSPGSSVALSPTSRASSARSSASSASRSGSPSRAARAG